ncbi:MAG: D-alanyl-D-alanine carboxypeptidase family protein [Ruminococcus sp.]|nr:D-alanyl-D-alanine carboxypeptidase family protein [Ruminococcus sp.]MDE6784100.1 D-alanyl-D-alanine carboxypeptidase family protein [Ruminococcus sp.]
MNKGEKRRKNRRYRIRYDRIIIFVLLIAAMGVVGTSAFKAITGRNEKNEESSSESESIPELPAVTDDYVPEDTTTTDSTEPETTITTAVYPVITTPEGMTDVVQEHDNIYKGNLIVVNNQYEYKFLPDDIEVLAVYENQNSYYSTGDLVTSLDRETITNLNAMMEAYAAFNGSWTAGILIQDGYRTYEEQEYRHNSGQSRTFEAGHADYHTGRTFDMFRVDSYSATGYSYFEADEWFRENAGKYGFIVRYPEGKYEYTGENPRAYTYRYVGIPHAEYINTYNLCLEEYIDILKTHTIENPLETAADGHIYSIYYVPAAESGNTDVFVPENSEYTISGDNGSGFIVTTMLS